MCISTHQQCRQLKFIHQNPCDERADEQMNEQTNERRHTHTDRLAGEQVTSSQMAEEM